MAYAQRSAEKDLRLAEASPAEYGIDIIWDLQEALKHWIYVASSLQEHLEGGE